MPESNRLTLHALRHLRASLPEVKIPNSTVSLALRTAIRQPVDEILALERRIARDAEDSGLTPTQRATRRRDALAGAHATVGRAREALETQKKQIEAADSSDRRIRPMTEAEAQPLRAELARRNVTAQVDAIEEMRAGRNEPLLHALASGPNDSRAAEVARELWQARFEKEAPRLRSDFAQLNPQGQAFEKDRMRAQLNWPLVRALATSSDQTPAAIQARAMWDFFLKTHWPGAMAAIEDRAEALEAASATLNAAGSVLHRASF